MSPNFLIKLLWVLCLHYREKYLEILSVLIGFSSHFRKRCPQSFARGGDVVPGESTGFEMRQPMLECICGLSDLK